MFNDLDKAWNDEENDDKEFALDRQPNYRKWGLFHEKLNESIKLNKIPFRKTQNK
jgi:hypothetical protein